MPYDFLVALQHAELILSLQADLTSAEMPPEWMWPLPWEMERALERVAADRKAGRIRTAEDDSGSSAEPGDGEWIENSDLPSWLADERR